jgi:hypothetical protein
MSSRMSDECVEFGVLFVPGFAEQRPGSAIASFATALYRWLFRWNSRPNPHSTPPPTLSHAVLSGLREAGDETAHLTLTVPLNLSTGERDAHWMLAESSWADLFTPPRFLGIAQWIWKVSTCLLVLQFVIPMRRHWHRARRADKPWHRRAADGVVAVSYVVPMAVAAMASVLLSLVLLALAMAEKLPIPRIDQAVRWVAVKLSAVLGDSYMLAHCPVQFAAMQTQVARDLRWLQDRCEKVAVVAHSQGAAIAHQVLKDGGSSPGSLQAFVTLGQGITKLHLLQRMDWDTQVHRAAWWSRLLVTGGLSLAGLSVLGLLAHRWMSAVFVTKLFTLPLSVSLPFVGFMLITIGVVVAMHALCGDLEQDLALPAAGFSWTDYYASADPVSNGPLAPSLPQAPVQARGGRASARLLPTACNQVYNSASILFDHNRYLRNQDQLLSRILNDLAAAAYADGPVRPEIVRDCDLIEVGQRRHRLVLWLIGARLLATALAVGLWWVNLGRPLKGPMNQLVHLLTPKAGMDDVLARLIAAVLTTAVIYMVAVILWRIRERYVMRAFFHTAEPFTDPAGQLQHQPATRPVATHKSATFG